jgi:hypothetical protein
VYSKGCEASKNYADGFNYHTTVRVLEENCNGYDNGWSLAQSNNGSSIHENNSIIRVNCNYSGNNGPQIADIVTADSWNIHCSASNPFGVVGWQNTGFYSEGNQWLHDCTASGCTFDIYEAGAETTYYYLGSFNTAFGTLVAYQSVNESYRDVKVIECVSAGTLWLDRKFMNLNNSEAAYGSWRWSLYHNLGGSDSYVGLTCSAKSAVASHNGYIMAYNNAGLRSLYRHAGAVNTLVFDFSTGGEKIHVTRRFDGYWYGSIKPAGNWIDFGAYPGALDTTYTTSEGMCFQLNPGDRLKIATIKDDDNVVKFLGEFLPQEV